MPIAMQVLEVPLPEGVELGAGELELLKAIVEAIVVLRRDQGQPSSAARALEAAGWTVQVRLGWCAEARRGRNHERALGATPARALEELHQLTRLDDSGEAPS